MTDQENNNAEELETPEEQPEGPSLEEQLAEMKDRWLRSVAENENIRRRSQKEREDALKYGAFSFAKEMVAVADNVQRALESAPTKDNLAESVQSFITGVEMIAKEFHAAFERQGIYKVPSMGQLFDPNYHQAMFEVESSDHPAGTIIQVLQEGYLMHERLLRPALVGVAKRPTEQIE